LAGQDGTSGHAAARASPGSVPVPGERILTSREARAFLRIGRTTLHELTRDQRIPAYRIGDGKTSSLRYRMSDLLAWLLGRRV
jgi:excisionase family DNA binding protein